MWGQGAPAFGTPSWGSALPGLAVYFATFFAEGAEGQEHYGGLTSFRRVFLQAKGSVCRLECDDVGTVEKAWDRLSQPLKSGFDFDDEVDFDGDVEGEGGGTEGGAGVFAFVAKYSDH